MTFLSKYREAGLLLLRLSLGCFFLYLSAPVLIGGAAKWAHFAAPLRHLGLHSHLQWWGLAGALVQTIGSVLMIFGLFFRIGVILVLICLTTHALSIWKIGSIVAYASLLACLILVSLLFVGPGRMSVDKE